MFFFGRERARPPRGSGSAWAVRRRRGVSGKVLRTPREHGERPERGVDQNSDWIVEDGSWKMEGRALELPAFDRATGSERQ